ncbi:endoplasmic reticulum vesicle transporter-domain-containing protein [Sporodiniella umbellata]|nr:endoplasmic reticulum vesicle transporter-domain-containing protein [Sporodiniella umbellata]
MAKKGSLFRNLRQFDGYAKTLDEFRIKTTSGASVTLISAMIVLYLVFSELIVYRTSVWKPSLVVDGSRKEKMPINFNITFPNMPCHMLSIDIMDETGEQSSGYTQDVTKVRLDRTGKIIETGHTVKLGDHTPDMDKIRVDAPTCGECYGATPIREDGCCHTCQDVREAYVKQGWGLVDPKKIDQCVRENWANKMESQANEGCNVFGHLLVNKVRGNFHFAPGGAFQAGSMHVHDLQEYAQGSNGHSFDMTHTIHKLKFGPDTQDENEAALAMTDPLAATNKPSPNARTIHQYFLKIVSTELRHLKSVATHTNQYSFINHQVDITQGSGGLPGVFFNMEISPMLVIYQETRPAFSSFLTGLLAIIGGIFTVAGLVDRVLYKAERAYKKKMEMGKTQ